MAREIKREIKSVAVLGGGTMGTGIAGLCAERDCRVLLLDVSLDAAEMALERIVGGRPPAIETPEKAANISLGSFDDDLEKIADYDWICEAVVEDLATKRALFERLEPLRRDGSVVSTNTSGIPLRDITEDMPDRLRRDIAVTHFFNPVKVMRLLELVPGADTEQDTIDTLADFCGGVLGKGIVYANDTVNFIGNRIGCYLMLVGMHRALESGLSSERIDALLSAPVGLPATGLFGLIDLVGLDIMDLVGKNLAVNLPVGDLGVDFAALPGTIHKMLEAGQIGRKAGGGFYRMIKHDDGSRTTETFELAIGDWRATEPVTLDAAHSGLDVVLGSDTDGKFCWHVIGATLAYAADLVPEIAGDLVNIDRAMRWGYGWARGPFEMLDALGPEKVAAKLEADGLHVPKMLRVLREAGAKSFYHNHGAGYLGLDGAYHPTPPE